MLIVLAIIVSIILVIAIFKYPMIPLGLFLMIASFKGLLMLKFGFFRVVDATVLCAVLVLIAMSYSFVKSGGRMKDILNLPLALYLFLAIILLFGLAYTPAPSYGFEKSTRFATLGLIAFLAPIFFTHNRKDVKMMIWILLIVGIILSLGTVIAPYYGTLRIAAKTRGGFLEAGALQTAAKIGMGSLIAFIFVIMAHTSNRLRVASLVVVPLAIAGIIMTESRAPFLGLIFIFMVAMFIFRKGVSRGWVPIVITVTLIGVVVLLIKMPETVTQRMSILWRGGYALEKTIALRFEPYFWVANELDQPILGHGPGAYAVGRGIGDIRYHPHNIFLELLYEQGLVGLIIGSSFLWLIFRRWRQTSKLVYLYELDIETFEIVHMAGLLFLFMFIQALKASDINENRPMFFCAGLVIAVFNLVRSRVEEISLENELIAEEGQHLESLEVRDAEVLY